MRTAMTAVCLVLLLNACASGRPDHFYLLSALPPGGGEVRPDQGMRATLTVSLPSWADRSEMLLNASAGEVIILEHERWVAPLGDLVRQTLALDLERRRSDLTVGSSGRNRPQGAELGIAVEVVQLSVRKAERVRIEARWQVHDLRTGKDLEGGAEFSAALANEDYASVAQSLSECLALLADRLVQQIH